MSTTNDTPAPQWAVEAARAIALRESKWFFEGTAELIAKWAPIIARHAPQPTAPTAQPSNNELTGYPAVDPTAVQIELRRRMELAGITQSELARRMGVSRQYVSRFLDAREGANFTVGQLDSIAAAIGDEILITFAPRNPDQPTAPTAQPAANPENGLAEAVELSRKIQMNKITMIGTMMFQPTGASASFAIPDDMAMAMIADQYGADNEVTKTFPHCDDATVSVRAGMIKFLSARIAAQPTATTLDDPRRMPVESAPATAHVNQPAATGTPDLYPWEFWYNRAVELDRELAEARTEVERVTADWKTSCMSLKTQMKLVERLTRTIDDCGLIAPADFGCKNWAELKAQLAASRPTAASANEWRARG